MDVVAASREARRRVGKYMMHTPLARLEIHPETCQFYLKLENLQPTGSFKVRGAGSALLGADPAKLQQGVWTASAGNMAQAVAWYARRMGLPCTAVVPHDAPAAKRAAIQRLGGQVLPIPFGDYQSLQRAPDPYAWLEHYRHPLAAPNPNPQLPNSLLTQIFVHPFADPAVIAGNGVIGLEILEDLPDVEAVVIPYGGGGLSCGIAAVLRSLRPQVKIYACEVATAAPLAASLEAGRPVNVPYAPSFVSGMGAPFVFEAMWPSAHALLDGSLVVSLEQVAEAIRLLAIRAKVVSEGAGAVALAAALAGMAGEGKIACIVSGGNIDPPVLSRILEGHVPQ